MFERAFTMGQDIKAALVVIHKISDDIAGGKGCFEDLTREEAPVACQGKVCILERGEIGRDFNKNKAPIERR